MSNCFTWMQETLKDKIPLNEKNRARDRQYKYLKDRDRNILHSDPSETDSLIAMLKQ